MDARYYNGEPDDRDDALEHEAQRVTVSPERRHEMNCYVLLETVRMAANPLMPEWFPYRGNVLENALWWLHETLRHARAQRLIADSESVAA